MNFGVIKVPLGGMCFRLDTREWLDLKFVGSNAISTLSRLHMGHFAALNLAIRPASLTSTVYPTEEIKLKSQLSGRCCPRETIARHFYFF